MTTNEAMTRAVELLRYAKVKDPPSPRNFLEYGALVAAAARDLPGNQRLAIPWLKDWAKTWRKLYDDFDRLVIADPMLLYEPINKAVLEFHESKAYIRYMRMPNRSGKTHAGVAEHYFVTTGQHRWRWFPRPPVSTFLIAGLPFSTYAPQVFEKKFIAGEDANPISPIFPEGGKWLYHYDARKFLLTIACPDCAEAGKAGACSHPKSTIKLFSDENGWEVLQGMAAVLGHFDEHVDEDFYNEARQRTKTVPGGCLIVTGTPLHGEEAWEQTRLVPLVDDPVRNRVNLDDPQSAPFVSLHQISRYEANIEPAWQIKAEEDKLDEFEAQARIYGRPAPLAKNPVFDRKILQEMRKKCRTPALISLGLPSGVNLSNLQPGDAFTAIPNHDSLLRVWEAPEEGAIYILSVDTATGLSQDPTRGDNSCGSVLKVLSAPLGVALTLVAQLHGKITLLDYADEVMKLAAYYNSALVAVELTGGYGHAVVMRLKEHAYWNMYRPPQDKAAVEMHLDPKLGVDTSAQSKPFMVSSLQYLIKNRQLDIPCTATIGELVAFTQETTGSHGVSLQSPRYRGASGSHDDRVMSLAIAAGIAISDPRVTYQVNFQANRANWGTKMSSTMESVFNDIKEENSHD